MLSARVQSKEGIAGARFDAGFSAAFTLLEVLVIVVVIGVLLGILLPTLGSVRRSSGEIRCLSNIRDSSVAILQYAAECRDAVPAPPMVTDNRSFGNGPRGRITCGQTWIEMDYFGSGSWWGAVIRAHTHEEQPPTWTCSGFKESSQMDPALWGYPVKYALCDSTALPSTYTLSDTFLAVPGFWRTGEPQLITEIHRQHLGSVFSPSRKVMLFETVVFHRSAAGIRTRNLKVPCAPVLFVDAHAAARDFRDATPGVVNRFAPLLDRPMRNTENGVLGIDY